MLIQDETKVIFIANLNIIVWHQRWWISTEYASQWWSVNSAFFLFSINIVWRGYKDSLYMMSRGQIWWPRDTYRDSRNDPCIIQSEINYHITPPGLRGSCVSACRSPRVYVCCEAIPATPGSPEVMWDAGPLVDQCRASVVDADPALISRWLSSRPVVSRIPARAWVL